MSAHSSDAMEGLRDGVRGFFIDAALRRPLDNDMFSAQHVLPPFRIGDRFVVVSSFRDVAEVLGSETYLACRMPPTGSRFSREFERTLPFLDGPVHADLRRSVNGRWRRRIATDHAATASAVRSVVDRAVVNAAAESEQAGRWTLSLDDDWLRLTLPLTVTAKFLGMDETRVERFVSCGRRLRPALDDYVNQGDSLADAKVADIVGELREIAPPCVPRRMLFLLAMSGVDSVAATTATTVATLHRYGLLTESVLRDHVSMLDMVAESTRLHAPMPYVIRYCTADHTVGSVTIRAGDLVAVCIASANLDPEFVTDPHEFNPARRPRRTISFGWAAHRCLGEHLAEAQVAACLGYCTELGLRFALPETPYISWPTNPAFLAPSRIGVLR